MVMFFGISRADKPGQSIIIINIALLLEIYFFSVEWIFLIINPHLGIRKGSQWTIIFSSSGCV